MAKDKGEVERGVHCNRCNRIVQWDDKKRIIVWNFIRGERAIDHREVVGDRFNLCNSCYEEWNKIMNKFITQNGGNEDVSRTESRD